MGRQEQGKGDGKEAKQAFLEMFETAVCYSGLTPLGGQVASDSGF